MCGIAGVFGREGLLDERLRVEGMLEAIHHRGPDDMGVWVAPDLTAIFGHKRLSILDLSSKGHQPMSTPDKSIVITYNGEVYNFKEIKEELVTLGYSFASNTDTEVILHAYHAWGIECINKFNGMFAFALLDQKKKKIYLVRDRAGVKPLYYCMRDKKCFFASELKALIKTNVTGKHLNHESVSHFLQFGYISSPNSIFNDVHVLKPGHYLEMSFDLDVKEVCYWDIVDFYNKQPNKSPNIQDLDLAREVESLEEVLTEGFAYRMIADVPVGIFLSGGIDSSILALLLVKKLGMDIKTFTIGFNNPEYNEAHYAKDFSNLLGTNHVELYIDDQTMLDSVLTMPSIMDEPFGDNSVIPTHLVSCLAGEHVKVALSADGADELFCGYTRYDFLNNFYARISRMPRSISFLSEEFIDVLPVSVIDNFYKLFSRKGKKVNAAYEKIIKVRNVLKGRDAEYLAYTGACSDWHTKDLDKIFRHNSGNNGYDIENIFSSINSESMLTKMMCTDFKKYMMDDVLVKVDRASMATSIEVREPFLDKALMEHVAQLPMQLKFRNGERKFILKEIMRKYLPEEYISRPKQGFSSPVRQWLLGPLKPLVMEYLSSSNMDNSIFDVGAVQKYVARFYSGKNVSANQIWYLLQFELWKRQWLN